jgi:hypothetical protein
VNDGRLRGRRWFWGYKNWCLLDDAVEMETAEGLAWDGMHELVERDSDEAAWALQAVAKSLTVDDKRALGSLDADALEDLLKSDPEKYIPMFEQAAVADARVAIAMSGVWIAEPWRSRLAELRRKTKQPRGGY